MNELYGNDVYCMDFTGKEINEYLIKMFLSKIDTYIIKYKTGEMSKTFKTEELIKCIYIDGERGNFLVSFYGHRTSIYIEDESNRIPKEDRFNHEFMFIDDNAKESITFSDTFHNVVYEGMLRDKTHAEILKLIGEFIIILHGAQSIKVEATFVSQQGFQYPKNDYTVRIRNESTEKKRIQKENVLFIINE